MPLVDLLGKLPFRLVSKLQIDEETGCWNWKGSICGGGYGGSWLNGHHCVAHRVVWYYLKGEIPEGLELDHLCRNRKCVNPEHLEPVTPKVNRQRQTRKNSFSGATHCIRGHEFGSDRVCHVCRRARQRRDRAGKGLPIEAYL